MTVQKRSFATGTSVTPAKSLEQIRKQVSRFGCSSFAMAEDDQQISILFVLAPGTDEERRVRYTVAKPSLESMKLAASDPTSRTKSEQGRRQAKLDAEISRIWRALARSIEGKLIAVEEGIETFEEAFYQAIVLPNGRTVYEETRDVVAESYRTKSMVPLIPAVDTEGGRWILEPRKQ